MWFCVEIRRLDGIKAEGGRQKAEELLGGCGWMPCDGASSSPDRARYIGMCNPRPSAPPDISSAFGLPPSAFRYKPGINREIPTHLGTKAYLYAIGLRPRGPVGRGGEAGEAPELSLCFMAPGNCQPHATGHG